MVTPGLSAVTAVTLGTIGTSWTKRCSLTLPMMTVVEEVLPTVVLTLPAVAQTAAI